MPSYSILYSKLRCPYCNSEFKARCGQIPFFWGKVPTYYSIGEKIIWLKDRTGNPLPPFSRTSDLNCINFGDSKYENVFALDPELLWWTEEHRTCESCHEHIDAIAVVIRGGTVDSVKVFKSGELAKMIGNESKLVDIVIIRDDGSYWPRFDWYDDPDSES